MIARLAGAVLAVLLACVACGGQATLLGAVSASPAVVQPSGRQPTEPIQLRYTLSRPATVTLRVQPQAGDDPIVLRAAAHLGAGPHFVLFNGVVDTGAVPGATATPVARVLPDGLYRFLVSAVDDSRQQQDEATTFTVQDARTAPPALENLQIYPATISPNSDAVDDVAQITYRLADTGTTTVLLQGAAGPAATILAPVRQPPGEQRVVFNGQDLLGRPVGNGTYTVTVRTADRAGNTVAASRPLTIADSGTPNIALITVKMDPPALLLGGKLHVHLVVQNTGNVPLRTQGPDSGYTYDTSQSYAGVAGGRYEAKAGLWRVGLDWDGNAGGAPYRYPFRWGFGNTLAPGASATIDGYVVVRKQESTMWFFAGVLQEGVAIVQDGLGRTPVHVSW